MSTSKNHTEKVPWIRTIFTLTFGWRPFVVFRVGHGLSRAFHQAILLSVFHDNRMHYDEVIPLIVRLSRPPPDIH